MNQVVHFEIGGTDTDKAAEFYEALFGWNIAAGPVRSISGAGMTGHLNALGHEPHNYCLVYVGVDDVDASLAKAEGLGARKLVGPIPIPTGRFAWILDPTGTTIGLFEAAAA
jgi:predicted enzyme related to lactoylglutathione lyase